LGNLELVYVNEIDMYERRKKCLSPGCVYVTLKEIRFKYKQND